MNLESYTELALWGGKKQKIPTQFNELPCPVWSALGGALRAILHIFQMGCPGQRGHRNSNLEIEIRHRFRFSQSLVSLWGWVGTWGLVRNSWKRDFCWGWPQVGPVSFYLVATSARWLQKSCSGEMAPQERQCPPETTSGPSHPCGLLQLKAASLILINQRLQTWDLGQEPHRPSVLAGWSQEAGRLMPSVLV